MIFNNIIGHKEIINSFKNFNYSHAMLFSGKEGIGKFLTAKMFAKYIFCDTKKENCTCKNCMKIDHNNHPDLHILIPEKNMIKNDQIIKLQEFLMIKSHDTDSKIVIIDDAHLMNERSQNRLLKTLEEPPENSYIILISDNKDSLLQTVLSRCMTIQFNDLSEDDIKLYLDNHNINTNLDEVSKLADGSIKKATDISKDDDYLDKYFKVRELIDNIVNKREDLIIKNIDLFSDKESIFPILDNMILWYRDILLYKKTKIKKLLYNNNDDIKVFSRKLSIKKIIESIDIIEETKNYINKNINYDLSIEIMIYKLLE